MSEKLKAQLTALKNQKAPVTVYVANGFQMSSPIEDFADDYIKLASGEIVMLCNVLTIKRSNKCR